MLVSYCANGWTLSTWVWLDQVDYLRMVRFIRRMQGRDPISGQIEDGQQPGSRALVSSHLLHARAGVHVTNAIPAQRLSAGQEWPGAGVRAGLIAEVPATTYSDCSVRL